MKATEGKPPFWETLSLSIKSKTAAWLVVLLTVVSAVLIGVSAGLSQLANTIIAGGMWALMGVGSLSIPLRYRRIR